MASWPDVRVACVWLPQFPLRVEMLRHPAWDGLPFVLGGGPGERKVVRLCSPEAERAGIRPGLPLREALHLCREAVILEPDPVQVARVREEILRGLEGLSPIVEAGQEAFYLDLRGLAGLFHGDPGELELAVRTVISPLLQPRLGLAVGKFTAAVAAREAPSFGLRVVPAPDSAAFLAPLPIRHLPFPPELWPRLELLGLRTIGDLARLPFSAVQAEFGLSGARAWRLAHGQDEEPLVPRPIRPVARAALRAEDPLSSAEALTTALRQLVRRAFARPEMRGRAVRQARLQALLSGETSWERLLTFKEALPTPEVAWRALKGRLELPGFLPPAPVEELVVELVGLDGLAASQPSLLQARPRQQGQIAEAVRQLRTRYGRSPVYRILELEPWSRIPERRWTLMPYEP